MKFLFIFLLITITCNVSAQDEPVKEYYDNNVLKSEVTYKEGIREGKAKFYYPNGNLNKDLTYINGKVEGLVSIYNEDGKLKELFNIENGRREGPTSVFNDEGIYQSDLNFYEGRVAKEELYVEADYIEETAPDPTEPAPEIKKHEKKIKPKPKNSDMPVPPSFDEDKLEDDPAFYLNVEVMPEPKWGWNDMMRRLVYPKEAREEEIEGVVKIKAYIDQYGEVTTAEIVEGIGYGCDESAKSLIFYTKFKPGQQRGKPVKVQMVIPVEFKLNQ